MAVKRGKSQARRNSGHHGSLPGWAWLILGIVIAVLAMLFAPRLLKSNGADGFIRPRPNPDAQPAARRDDDSLVPDPGAPAAARAAGKAADGSAKAEANPQYDFYTLLPGQEVAMSDAELAASARAEQARQRKLAAQQAQAATPAIPSPGTTALTPAAGGAPALPATQAAAPASAAAVASAQEGGGQADGAPDGNQAHYILQAGAFGASGDAEALKARIALLGLNARVESAQINAKTVYRVRMGPYGSAGELAGAKDKLANGGLPAMAVKVK